MNLAVLVYLKEIRDMIRDKRTRGAAVAGPILSVVLMFALFGVVGSSIKQASKTKLHVVGNPQDQVSRALIEGLKKAEFTIETIDSSSQAEKLIRSGKVRLALDFGAGLDTIRKGKSAQISALLDPSDTRAQIALSALERAIDQSNLTIVKQLLSSKDVDPELATPLKVVRKEIKVGETASSDVLTSFLPYLIVIWAFYGAFSISSDIVAGEKERQTLETLLISPASRTSIAFGKLLALCTLSLVSALMSVLTVLIIMMLKLPMLKMMFDKGLSLTPTGLLAVTVALIPMVLLFGSGLLAISAYAKNTRECQTYLAQASTIVLMPAVFSQIIGYTEAGSSLWVNFVPVLNTANIARNALLGRYDWTGIGIAVATGLVLSVLAMRTAVKLFEREEVLTRV